LRSADINTELYPDPSDKLDKQFKYADRKGIPYALVIGEDEVKNNTVTLKNLSTREQVTLPVSEAISSLKN
jgi:Histidyl-tRNA synthetase